MEEVKSEENLLWQEYLQKCCEVGQLLHTLDQIDGQKSQFEKQLEVTQRAVKSAAEKHRQAKQKALDKANPQKQPEVQ